MPFSHVDPCPWPWCMWTMCRERTAFADHLVEGLPGIGPNSAQALCRHSGSAAAVFNGVGSRAARCTSGWKEHCTAHFGCPATSLMKSWGASGGAPTP